MADNGHRSHEVKQQLLEKKFGTDIERFEVDMNDWIEQQNRKISSAQEREIRELCELIQTRAKIEREISAIAQELSLAYVRNASILKVALDGRVNDYDQSLKKLSDISSGTSTTQGERSQEL